MRDDQGNWLSSFEPIDTILGYAAVPPDEYEAHLRAMPFMQRIRDGKFGLEWLTAEPGESPLWAKWGVRAEPSKKGLTLMDTDRALGESFATPGVAPASNAMRGCGQEPGEEPVDWEISEKSEVWANNIANLYEEAVSRQWSATRDIDWQQLEMLNPTYERAFCQFATFLASFEYLANDLIAPFIPKVSTTFHEVKMFLASQLMDEARHSEVFRKRCLANGGGLGMNINLPLHFARAIDTYPGLSFGIHVLFEGVILDVFRFGEFLGQNDVDKQIFRMVMQDEARHVAYGTMHLKHYLDGKTPEERAAAIDDLSAFAKMGEPFFLQQFLLNPAIIEALAVCAVGGDLNRIDRGLEIFGVMFKNIRQEYLRRLERCGMGVYAESCMIPAEPPFLPEGHDLSAVEAELIGA